MSGVLRHRGPDQSGIYAAEGVSLGHQRLSIIDLSENGRQPMQSLHGRVWITYNGEVYNYRRIRETLEQKGYSFRSRTDTEVILNAYLEYGYKCLEKLNGMFAFCIWDAASKSLFLARDRLGKKPLYYYYDQKHFVFASEIKSLLKNPKVPKKINFQALFDFVGYEFIPAPMTIFEGICKLPPGHYLRVSEAELNVVPYWEPSLKETRRSRKDLEIELVERLEAAVHKRLESDVPLGVFLSGGIDSSSIVAMMSRITGSGVRTFSLGYREAGFTEFSYARKVAEHFNTKHTELLIDPVRETDLERAIWHLDEPLSEFSVLPYYLISRKAREHVTVCLSGEGGDELFVGYDRFKASKFNRFFTGVPSLLRQCVNGVARSIADSPKKKSFFNNLKRFLDGADLNPAGRHMRWQYFLNTQDRSGLFAGPLLQQIDPDPFRPIIQNLINVNSENELALELYLELRFMMPENPLMKVDKMSMAHGLEVRAPLLDYEFVEFVNSIPVALKLEGWTTKSILKSAMKDILPEGIAYRAKHGYSFPIKHWLRQELRNYTQEIINSSPVVEEYFNKDYLNRLNREHLQGFHNHSHVLWAFINFALWHRRFIEEDTPNYAEENNYAAVTL